MLILRKCLREMTLLALLSLGFFALNAFGDLASPGPTSAIEIFRRSLEDNIRVQLASKLETDISQIRVKIDNLQVRPSLPLQDEYTLQALGLGAAGTRRFDGLFQLGVLIEAFDSSRQIEVEVTGNLQVTGPVVVAAKSIFRGQVVNPTDITTKILPWKILPTGASGRSSAEFLGLASKIQIAPGDPLHEGLFEQPHLVKSGERVELTLYSGPGVIIRSHGVARQAGRLGETIRIEQPETKKAVAGSITGPKSVEVRL